jgi:hypothetical protein
MTIEMSGLRRRAWIALAALGALLAWQGNAMAKMVIFSAIGGKVLQDGKPVPGASVEREFRWSWKDEVGTDSTTTGNAGEFSFEFWGQVFHFP